MCLYTAYMSMIYAHACMHACMHEQVDTTTLWKNKLDVASRGRGSSCFLIAQLNPNSFAKT